MTRTALLPHYNPVLLLILLISSVILPATAESQRDTALETRLDKLIGVASAPRDKLVLQQLLSEITDKTPVATQIRARTYQALQLAIIDRDTEQAQSLLNLLQRQAIASGNTDNEAEVLNARGEISLYYQQRENTQTILEQLAPLLDTIHNPRIHFNSLHLFGRTLLENAEYEPALKYLLQAHEIISATNDSFTQLRRQFIKLYIARLQSRLQNYQYVIELVNETIQDAHKYNLDELLPDLYLVRGYSSQLLNGPTDEAVNDFEKASQPPKGLPPGRTQMLAMNNLGTVQLYRGNYDAALGYFDKGIHIGESINNQHDVYVMKFNIGYIKVLQGDKEQGITRMEEAFSVFSLHAPLADQASMLGYFANALKIAGESAHEAEILREQLHKREQAFQSERDKVYSELQVRYEAQEQSMRIRMLEQESTLKQSELEISERNQLLFTILTLILLAGLITMFWLVTYVRKLNRLLHQANKELQELSQKDPLTQLHNRRILASFHEQAGDLLLLMDIDNFKQINDTYGHDTGDAVLVEVARRLTAASRSADLVARWGGEEFLLVMRGVEKASLDLLIRKMLRAVTSEPVENIHITISGGAVLIPDNAQSWEQALKQADALLYDAKKHGRKHIRASLNNTLQQWDCEQL